MVVSNEVAALVNASNRLTGIKAIAFDFDGVFTDNRVHIMENGEEAVTCDRSDGMGISMLRKVGLPLVIISSEKNLVVTARGAKLGIEVLQGIDEKLPTLIDWATVNHLTVHEIAFIGNDINDVQCLNAAGLGVVVADAYPVAVDAADFVLGKKGGRGAVREIADLWLAANTDFQI